MKKYIKKTIKKIFKNIAIIGLASLIFLGNTFPALAISASSIAAQLEKRYHLNLESIRNQGENFNVSDNKKNFPQVFVSFSPQDPVPGKKITAQALPLNFFNAPENLYYTWYLRKVIETENGTVKCNIDSSLNDDEKHYCDEDKDGKITQEDWKIAAMREIARGGWEPNYKDKDIREDDPERYSKYYEKVREKDEDGYRAGWGGDLSNGGREDTGSFGEADNDEAYCYLYDAVSGTAYELYGGGSNYSFNCPENTSAQCVDDETLTCSSNEYNICGKMQETPICNGTIPTCSSGRSVCLQNFGNINCSNPPTSTNQYKCSNVSTPIESCSISGFGTKKNLCHHVFADASTSRYKSGDGEFKNNTGEEKFWGTNPEDQDTADNGNFDEANVIGLGQNEFSWVYNEGDEVGVIIEGMALVKTKHDDASAMVTWATPVKNCSMDGYEKGVYVKMIKGYPVKIPYVSIHHGKRDGFWRECMEDNLIDPRTGGQSGKLNITLTKSPDDPINDPGTVTEGNYKKGKRGDIVTVQSSIENLSSGSATKVEYDWKIKLSERGSASPNSFDWVTVCDSDSVGTDDCLFTKEDISNLKGNDLSSVSFRLNLSEDKIKEFGGNKAINDGVFYLKVLLAVRENFSSSTTRQGKEEIIIKVLSNNDKIKVFIPEIEQDKYLLKERDDEKLICEDKDPKSHSNFIQENYCFVIKNQIIGLKLDGKYDEKSVAWKLDNAPLSCDENISKKHCKNGQSTEFSFFPVTKEIGEKYTVSVSAVETQTGKTHNFFRNFIVIDPYVKIIPYENGSDVLKKYIGRYIPLEKDKSACESDPEICHEYSENEFEVEIGKDIALQAKFYPDWIGATDDKYEWKVNMEEEKEDNFSVGKENGVLVINIKTDGSAGDVDLGDVFQVDFNSLYYQDIKTRTALNRLWRISQFKTTEDTLDYSVQVKIVDIAEQDEGTASSKAKRFFAAVFTNVPENFIFLFRIFLAASVLIFLAFIANHHPRKIN